MSFEVEKPIDPEKFNAWIGALLQEQGPDLLRTKGILSYANEDRRFAFQAVHMIADGDFIGPWKERRTAGQPDRVHRPQSEPPAAAARVRGHVRLIEPLRLLCTTSNPSPQSPGAARGGGSNDNR